MFESRRLAIISYYEGYRKYVRDRAYVEFHDRPRLTALRCLGLRVLPSAARLSKLQTTLVKEPIPGLVSRVLGLMVERILYNPYRSMQLRAGDTEMRTGDHMGV